MVTLRSALYITTSPVTTPTVLAPVHNVSQGTPVVRGKGGNVALVLTQLVLKVCVYLLLLFI